MSKSKDNEQEEKIREPKGKGEVPEGTTAGILQGLGGIIPGLGDLVKGLEKSAAFRERLGAIDREIETRLRSISHTKRQAAPQAKREVVASKEPPIDVFDEETHLRVLAELLGVEEKDIKVTLKENQLVISTDTPSHKYFKEIMLPWVPKGQMVKSYRNGVLELTLQKE